MKASFNTQYWTPPVPVQIPANLIWSGRVIFDPSLVTAGRAARQGDRSGNVGGVIYPEGTSVEEAFVAFLTLGTGGGIVADERAQDRFSDLTDPTDPADPADPECSDGDDNGDPEDSDADISDPGC